MVARIEAFFTVIDADGEPSRITFELDPTHLTFANVDGVLENAWDIINPLLNGQLKKIGITYETDIGTFTNAAANVLADVQEKATFFFRSVTGLAKRITLPTFIETFFLGAGKNKEVDTSATEVASFIAMCDFSTGIPNPDDVDNPIRVVNIHGDLLTTLDSATQEWGKNRK